MTKTEGILALLSVALISVQVWFDLKMPDYMAEITSLVRTEGSAMKDILKQGGMMMLCALGSLATAIIVGYFAAKIASAFSLRIRALVYNKVESFSMEEINRFSTSSLITRSTNDVTQVQMLVAMGLQVMIKAPILAVCAILKISNKSWQWTAATACAVFLMLILISILVIFALPKFKIIQGLTDNLNRVTRENLTGIRVVRAYNAENYQEEKFSKANKELTDTHLFTSKLMSIMGPGMTLMFSGLSLSIYWIGAYLINAIKFNGDMNAFMTARGSMFEDMVVFSAYAMQVVMAFMLLAMIMVIMPRAMVSIRRINEVIDTKPTIIDGDFSGETQSKGEIEFKNVSFKYPDAGDYVLTNISFCAKQGETVAFIGSTGSGKTTLIDLIPRFYDATEGEVLVDGINVKKYTQEALRNKLGYVSQKAVIFSGTVSSNIAYGDNGLGEITQNDVIKAAEIAQGKEFIENMDGQYEAAIAQGGTDVSGGQKQRISIARAIARKPEIYIFDDSFSALDYKTDKELRGALKNQTENATSLIVAQRIGTIKNADKIIVLDEGKIVGMGTHRELLKNCQVYQEIALSQLSKEELEDGEQ